MITQLQLTNIIIIIIIIIIPDCFHTHTHTHTHTHALTRIPAAQQQADRTHLIEIVASSSLVQCKHQRKYLFYIKQNTPHSSRLYVGLYCVSMPSSFLILYNLLLSTDSPHPSTHTHTHTHTHTRYVSFSCLSPLSEGFQ